MNDSTTHKKRAGRSITGGNVAAAANIYRDSFNPVAGLTIRRAVTLINSYPLGEYADLMWTFGAPFSGIESADADLMALIERRTAPLVEMDWNPLIVDREGIDQKLAEDQQALVRELMDGIENLYEAIAHMELASFRGFAHCEQIHDTGGALRELRCIDQWRIVRDGSRGAWRYNPEAIQTTYSSLPAAYDIDPASWLIRTVPRPIHRVALLKYIRENLSDKDWDAFIEIYGLPGGVVIGPPNVPEGREAEYEQAAINVAEGNSGYLPHGSTWTPNDSPRGSQPFAERLKHLSEKLILAGTGGKLTMLNEATGLGSGNAQAHTDTFEQLARAQARQISELIDAQIIQPRIRAAFPGKPILAYFAMAANEEIDTGQIVEQAAQLATAGYRIDTAELSEKTGYQLTDAPAPPATGALPLANRAKNHASPLQIADQPPAHTRTAPRPADSLKGEITRLANRGQLATQITALLSRMEAGETAAVDEALALLDNEGAALFEEPGLARVLERAATEAAVLGALGREMGVRLKNTQPRDEDGKFSESEASGKSSEGEIAKGKAAMARALDSKSDALDAMSHPELGSIDFRWGSEKGGLRHITEKHGESAALAIPDALGSGTVVKMTPNRAWVSDNSRTIILARDYMGSPANAWIVTSYAPEDS